jgi:uncharacterized protein with GYD domain
MLRYVALVNWTDQGIRNVKESTKRAEQTRQMVEQMGGRMTLYWTQGRYDMVAIIEAPDEETASAMALRIGSAGNVRSETMRAFDATEMGRILGKLG